MTDQTTEPDEAILDLVAAVARAIHAAVAHETGISPSSWEAWRPEAAAAIAAVRDWDAKREPQATLWHDAAGERRVTIHYPKGRPGAIYVRPEFVDALADEVSEG